MCTPKKLVRDSKTKMSVTVKTLKLTNKSPPLLPTPNVTEMQEMYDQLNKFPQTKKELVGEGPLQVIVSHRGSLLHLENGATVYRWEGESVNGYMCASKEAENCLVGYNGLWFDALVEFNF